MPFVRLWRVVFLVLALVAGAGSVALAQGFGLTEGQLIEEQREIVRDHWRQVDIIEEEIDASREQDGRLVEIRLKLEEISRELTANIAAFQLRLTEINARLEQLGPVEGQQDVDLAAAERRDLSMEKAEINSVLGLAETLLTRARELTASIARIRSELFRSLLTTHYPLVVALNAETLGDVKQEAASFHQAISSWLGFIIQNRSQSVLAAGFFALAAAAILFFGGRRVFRRVLHVDAAVEAPSYLNRLSLAFWSTLLPSATLGVFLAGVLFFLDHFDVLQDDVGIYLGSLFTVTGVVFCVNRLANALVSPQRPNWRLISIDTTTARRLVLAITAMAAVIGLNSFLTVVTDTMGSPLSLTVVRSFISALVVGVLLILTGLMRGSETNWKPWRQWLRHIAIGFGVLVIVTALLGYIGLSTFIAKQVVVTGSILITAYIGFLTARAIGAEGGFAETSVGRWVAAKSNSDAVTLDQMGLAVSLVLNLLVLLVFVPLILLMWGFQPGDIQGWVYRLGTGFSIGAIRFSPAGILTGIVVFVIGYFITRWVQAWLDGSVMARGRLDTGVRNSIRTVVGYAGLALAGLVALSSAGIDLSSFALIAGGLSLGIGFGLQNVVSNFVSGLILLAERPFKAGDWIVAGEVSGTVKKISVRATEIETFQRQTVILPNSELINSAVGNWTHRNKLGRIEIKVGVAYGSDVKRVHAILLDIAKSHPLVLRNPEPFVSFVNFGPAALEFEVRAFLADVLNGGAVQNDIRFSIIDAFGAEGIEIPSTSRAEMPKGRSAAGPEAQQETEGQIRPAGTRGRPHRTDPD